MTGLSDGRMVTYLNEKTLVLVDVNTGKEILRLKNHQNITHLTRISGDVIAWVVGDSTVKIFDIKLKRLTRVIKVGEKISQLAPLGEDRLIVVGDEGIIIYGESEEIQRISMPGVTKVISLEDGTRLGIVRNQKFVEWNLETNLEVDSLRNKMRPVGDIVQLRNGTLAVGILSFISLHSEPNFNEIISLGKNVKSIVEISGDKIGVILEEDEGIHIWNLSPESFLFSPIKVIEQESVFLSLAFFGDYLAAVTEGGEIKVWR